MAAPSPREKVELVGLQVLPDGTGFAMELCNDAGEMLRLEFPVWTAHQLMRVMPRLDAAMQQHAGIDPAALIAYAVVDWTVGRSGPSQGVALRLRNDLYVDAGYSFGIDDAVAFHQELGEAIQRIRTAQSARVVSSKVH